MNHQQNYNLMMYKRYRGSRIHHFKVLKIIELSDEQLFNFFGDQGCIYYKEIKRRYEKFKNRKQDFIMMGAI